MCSVGDDNVDDLENLKYMPEKSKISGSDKCNKCREETPCVLLRSKDKYCKNCFLTGTVHKFKALLGKHKLIRPNDRVLILHKGGHASTSLLHFIRTGLDLDTHKKLRFEPIVLFIDSYYHLSMRERKNLLKQVENETTYFNIKPYFVSLSKLIANDNTESAIKENVNLIELGENDGNILRDFLAEQQNKSNKTDMLNIIIRQFMISIAKCLKCKFIFSPDLSADAASQLLTDISLGRGCHAPLDTGFCDNRDCEVKILRPLRLFDTKELVYYNYFNSLEPVTFRETHSSPYDSIQSLMKKFVNDLQVNYPATVTTILKTGDKLAINEKSTTKCNFCHGPLEEEKLDLTAAESTQLSHWVSTQIPDYAVSPQARYNNLMQTFTSSACNTYCYACKKFKKQE